VASENSFIDEVLDRIQISTPATSKKMFGGHGIFHHGLMFGLITNNQLYFKADKQSEHYFKEINLQPFTYIKAGKPVRLSYYLAPESFFEVEDETITWTNRAIEAAIRAPRKNTGKP
jgi:DNA transformation protein